MQNAKLNMQLTTDGVYRTESPMTLDQLAVAAPASLASGAHDSRSDRFAPVSTLDVVDAIHQATGLQVYGATQQKTKDASRRGFAKHLLRLRPCDRGNGTEPELLLRNAYDGSSSFSLMFGFFEFACANGVVIGRSMKEYRIRHTGDAANQAAIAAQAMAQQFGPMRETLEQMKARILSEAEKGELCRQMLAVRAPDALPDNAPQLATACRGASYGDSLWQVFNNAQERLTRGLFRVWHYDGRGIMRRKKLRPIKSIDENTKINSELTEKALAFAKAC